jgi:assimilatory nitrate reductase catalytic subunit
MAQYQSGAQTRRVRSLTYPAPDAHVQMHPDLAAAHGVRSAELVELRTRRGTALFRARLDDGIRPDTVFTPFHWGGRSTANRLVNAALDPTSRMPEFKVCAVALRRADEQDLDLALLPT